jgi:hypothetical protein
MSCVREELDVCRFLLTRSSFVSVCERERASEGAGGGKMASPSEYISARTHVDSSMFSCFNPCFSETFAADYAWCSLIYDILMEYKESRWDFLQKYRREDLKQPDDVQDWDDMKKLEDVLEDTRSCIVGKNFMVDIRLLSQLAARLRANEYLKGFLLRKGYDDRKLARKESFSRESLALTCERISNGFCKSLWNVGFLCSKGTTIGQVKHLKILNDVLYRNKYRVIPKEFAAFPVQTGPKPDSEILSVVARGPPRTTTPVRHQEEEEEEEAAEVYMEEGEQEEEQEPTPPPPPRTVIENPPILIEHLRILDPQFSGNGPLFDYRDHIHIHRYTYLSVIEGHLRVLIRYFMIDYFVMYPALSALLQYYSSVPVDERPNECYVIAYITVQDEHILIRYRSKPPNSKIIKIPYDLLLYKYKSFELAMKQ